MSTTYRAVDQNTVKSLPPLKYRHHTIKYTRLKPSEIEAASVISNLSNAFIDRPTDCHFWFYNNSLLRAKLVLLFVKSGNANETIVMFILLK